MENHGLNQVYLSDTNASFSIDDNASFSFSLWVQVNSVPSAYTAAFGLRDFTGNWETLRIGAYHIQDQGKFAVDHLSTGTNSSHAVKAWANHTQLDRWYQITLVSSLEEEDSSLQSTVPFQRDALKNNNVAIYVGGDASWNLFNGSVDDVRIYNRALSVEEIELLYRAESPNHFVDSANHLEMIWVEPGSFTMGSPESETGRQTNETEHNVTLTKGFYLGKYEVTQAQYEVVMAGNTDGLSATPSTMPNNPNRPVEDVSWNDVQVFLARLNEQHADSLPVGWAYVLPSEAQWEYACRAGTTTAYSWGDAITTDNANYSSSGYSQTRDVGIYSANPWGFFDMHGNVWEWTADAWGAYASGAQTDPFNAGTTSSYRGRSGWFVERCGRPLAFSLPPLDRLQFPLR